MLNVTYAACHVFDVVVLNVVMLNDSMLNVVMLNDSMHNVVMLNERMLNVM
jgi:hypothetical protein